MFNIPKHKNRKNQFFLILIVALSFYSCCPRKTTITKFPDELKSWIPYQLNERHYYTDGNNLDSIDIVSYEKSVESKTAECTTLYHEVINIHAKGNQINLNISLSSIPIIFFHLPNITPYKSYSYDVETKEGNIVNHTTYEINNIKYNDVLVISKDSLEIYYGNNEGIIAYKIDSSLFVRQ